MMQAFTLKREKQLSTIGILITMASILMLFGTFISSFYVLKIRTATDLTLPNYLIRIGIVNTVILFLSSATFTLGAKRFREDDMNAYGLWLLLTIMGGFLFLFGQVYLWSELTHIGLGITHGQLSDMFYLMTGAHGLHICAGIASLIWLQVGHNNSFQYNRVHHVGMFWHFLGFLWVILFAVILF